jgi:hypothetical protein
MFYYMPNLLAQIGPIPFATDTGSVSNLPQQEQLPVRLPYATAAASGSLIAT